MYFNLKKKKTLVPAWPRSTQRRFSLKKKQNNIIFIKLLIQDICEPTDTDIRK